MNTEFPYSVYTHYLACNKKRNLQDCAFFIAYKATTPLVFDHDAARPPLPVPSTNWRGSLPLLPPRHQAVPSMPDLYAF